MTRIDFYSNAPDKLDLARLITSKAYRLGLKIMVHSPDANLLQALNQAWWEEPATGFLPHCRTTDEHAALTPVILGEEIGELPHTDVLVNLSQDTPSFFSRFERLIEIVTADPQDRDLARHRWKFYQQRGYTLTNHDMRK